MLLSKLKFVMELCFLLSLKTVVANLEVKSLNATFDNVYNFPIADRQKHILVYESHDGRNDIIYGRSWTKDNRSKHAISIICSAQNSYHDAKCPLILTVTQKSSVVFWKIIPSSDSEALNLDGNGTIKSTTERTICLEDDSIEDMLVTVELSTCSKTGINYTISVNLRNDLLISLNKLISTQITETSPAVYFLPPLPGARMKPEFVFIKMTSTSETCTIMSIQQPNCPVGDTVETMLRNSQWQTVSLKTALTIPADEFPSGFFIVFLLLPDDTWCNHTSLGQPEIGKISINVTKNVPNFIRRKTILFTIRKEVPTTEYQFAIFIPLGIFFIFISFIFTVHLQFHRMRCFAEKRNDLSNTSTSSKSGEYFHAVAISHQCTMGSTDSILRSRIQISELINGHPERLMVQSKRYYIAGILVASFYCVPVFQLIFSYQKRLQETGNFDLCYFNFNCSHRLGMFYDFNHIYSNIGYLICGPVFMAIVYMRQMTVEKSVPQSSKPSFLDLGVVEKADMGKTLTKRWLPRANWDISKGVFVHHGLFYAMGFSLFMTGVMSSIFHICPNQNNFQFDTAFMYTISALGIVTIYQFRHPTYISASMTFLVLAVVAASTVVGLLWESYNFRLFFTAIHVTFLLVILVYIHYVGYIRVDGVTVTEWRTMISILRQKWIDDIKNCSLLGFQRDIWSPRGSPGTVVLPGPCRLIFPILVFAVNFGALAMIWTTMRDTNFASQVLAVYVINCSVYKVYYSVMKMLHYECRGKLWIQPAFYLIMSIILWMWSLSYFGDVVTLWERSPAESRARNVECVFLAFYDSHDVWHLISRQEIYTITNDLF